MATRQGFGTIRTVIDGVDIYAVAGKIGRSAASGILVADPGGVMDGGDFFGGSLKTLAAIPNGWKAVYAGVWGRNGQTGRNAVAEFLATDSGETLTVTLDPNTANAQRVISVSDADTPTG